MRHVLLSLCLLAVPAAAARAQAAAPNGLYYVVTGAGPRTVVVLHGGPAFRHNYLRPEWDRLAQHSRLVYFDQRGCGLSPRVGPFGWQQHVTDLDSLIDFVSPQRPVVLAGSSWGAWLALLYSYFHPARVERVVLSGLPPWPDSSQSGRWSGFPASMRAWLDSLAYAPTALRKVVDSATIANSTPPAVAPPSLVRRLGPYCSDAAMAVWYSLRTAPPLRRLAAISAPTLIVEGTGDKSQGTGAEAVGGVLPRVTTVLIPGGGHDPWFADPDRVFTAIQDWLDTP